MPSRRGFLAALGRSATPTPCHAHQAQLATVVPTQRPEARPQSGGRGASLSPPLPRSLQRFTSFRGPGPWLRSAAPPHAAKVTRAASSGPPEGSQGIARGLLGGTAHAPSAHAPHPLPAPFRVRTGRVGPQLYSEVFEESLVFLLEICVFNIIIGLLWR